LANAGSLIVAIQFDQLGARFMPLRIA